MSWSSAILKRSSLNKFLNKMADLETIVYYTAQKLYHTDEQCSLF